MKRLLYRFITNLQQYRLKRKGWILSDNVVISMHGVRKMGGVRYIVQRM